MPGSTIIGIDTVTSTASTSTMLVTNDRVWREWNVYATTTSGGTGSGTSATDTIWTVWNDYTLATTTYSTTSATVNAMTWNAWARMTDMACAQQARQVIERQHQRAQPTAEQLEQWRIRDAERRAKADAVADQLKEARRRARQLLVACLTPQQREDLEQRKCFYLECHSPDGSRRRYRIDEGTHGNVKLVDDKNSIIGSYCVQPSGVPTEDAMLAQKLWLEADEAEFKRKANYRRHAA